MRIGKDARAIAIMLAAVGLGACAEYIAKMKADMAADDAAKDHMLQAADQPDGYERVNVPRGLVTADAFRGRKAKFCGEMFDVTLVTVGQPGPADQRAVKAKLDAAEKSGKTRPGAKHVMVNEKVAVAYGGVGADQLQSDAGQGNLICIWSDGVVDTVAPGFDVIVASRWNSAHEQRNREEFHKEFQKANAQPAASPAGASSAPATP